MMLWDLMINGSNYRKCQVPFHSTISVVYTDLLQRRQMMVMMICGLPRYDTAEGKLLNWSHDTNRTEIRVHGRSKFYRLSFKRIQVVFVELFLKGTVYCDKWNKSKEFRTDLFFLFVTFFTYCWETIWGFLDLMKLPMLVVKHDISRRSWFVYDASSSCSSLCARNGLEKSYCRGFEWWFFSRVCTPS